MKLYKIISFVTLLAFIFVLGCSDRGVNYGKENGWVKISYFEYDKNIIIEISDNGIGISEEHLPRIFERFYRVDQSRSRELGGTGLGLSIVKHIIEAHGTHVKVVSAEGEGSTFKFNLPFGKK